ncbi:hypothetical protein OsI_15582 [Oryza sativa Indica Group]|uniref:Rab-GAP TBC domain-containing protein n=1 Tax=Oryza sativa subsp. indica TaxID=39946 RepID=B8AT10_ORYSI|nr:hypothetical protein OsI_15582 [Oryza sativa Indica Group]
MVLISDRVFSLVLGFGGAQLQLGRKVVDLAELRRLACQGVPDAAGVRPVVWKLLLGYLPTDHALWAYELEKKRSQYSAFKDELLVNPSEVTRRMEEMTISKGNRHNSEGTGVLPRAEIVHDEHPLSLGKTSVWNQFFQESETIEQIDRDVKRTHPEMQFFNGDSSDALSNQESLKRILTIFAKLNPGIRYVQGMNEVLAPLYYVFKNDPEENNAESAEPDAFFCFVELLSGFRDNFCKQLDNSVVGIRSTISKLSQLLKRHDEELWRHLEVVTKVNPQFYAFRWITLLLTQEFKFRDCIHIWDALLGDPEGPQESAEPDAFFCFVELLSGFRDNFCKQLDNSVVGIRSTISKLSQLLKRHDEELWRHLEVVTKVNPQFYAFRWITLLLTQEFNFRDCIHIWDALLGDPEGPQATLLRICCAMLILVRRRLLAGDFTANLKLLQSYPPTNIDHLLHIANKLRGPIPY